jgi:hypothetical protein
VVSALPCPRCGAPLPAGAFYGPCTACRATLCSAADESADERLARFASALEAGWAWDASEACWIAPDADGDAR